MRIVLTNDDGPDSPGFLVLGRHLAAAAEVFAVVPRSDMSGTSHALTTDHGAVRKPIKYRPLPASCGLAGYVVDGYTVDCVLLAQGMLGGEFDAVVSGINPGANTGRNIHYSGTAAAALEAALSGRKGLAVSIDSRTPVHLDSAAILAVEVLKRLVIHPGPLVLNLNVPDLPVREIKGVKITRMTTPESNLPAKSGEFSGEKYVYDDRALAEGFASLTPLLWDLTDMVKLNVLEDWELHAGER